MGETTLSVLTHVRNWTVITNSERIEIKAILYAPLSDSPNQHIITYAHYLEWRQGDCTTLRADVSNIDKVTHFFQQMYRSSLFKDNLLEEWEVRANQSWNAT